MSVMESRQGRVVAAAAQRYRDRQNQRQRIERSILAGKPLDTLDERARVELRRARLMARGIEARDERIFERTLGASDLMPVSYLESGLEVARSVGRIVIRNGGGQVEGYGTGFLVSPRLLLTNNHVLSSAQEAAASTVELNYQPHLGDSALTPVPFPLDPNQFFVTDTDLDYSLVAVRDPSLDGPSLSAYDWIPLIDDEGKIVLGEYVSIIQHPNGEPKQLAVRENQLVDVLADFLHYRTDTEPGSSGSPVFNDQWEVVALHHSGVPQYDPQGNFVKWVANEGVRITRILRHLRSLNLPPSQDALRAQILSPPAHPEASGNGFAAGPATGTGISEPVIVPDGSARWMIPLQISVRLGLGDREPRRTPAQPVIAATGGVPSADGDLQDALAELREAVRKPYYSKTEDLSAREAYYRSLPQTLNAAQRFRELRALLKDTHRSTPGYRPSSQLYPWVDLHPNLMLRSIYSGEEYEPEAVIAEAFRIERILADKKREVIEREGALSPEGLAEELDALEASLPYNCEHAVPQSWFGKKEPMRGDLHHLFTCEADCNSFRGNTPYFDFPEAHEVIRQDCGRREQNASAGLSGFEPGFGKGAVARATLYFLLRYPGEIGRAGEFPEDRLELLLKWHRDTPVGRYELHRNSAIFKKQGNRNPLIDHPAWADQIDFRGGLA